MHMTDDVETKKHPMGKSRFALYYIAFCAGVFTFWQLIGGICVEYVKTSVIAFGYSRSMSANYAIGNSVGYIVWTWIMLAVWVIGSIIIWNKLKKAKD